MLQIVRLFISELHVALMAERRCRLWDELGYSSNYDPMGGAISRVMAELKGLLEYGLTCHVRSSILSTWIWILRQLSPNSKFKCPDPCAEEKKPRRMKPRRLIDNALQPIFCFTRPALHTYENHGPNNGHSACLAIAHLLALPRCRNLDTRALDFNHTST